MNLTPDEPYGDADDLDPEYGDITKLTSEGHCSPCTPCPNYGGHALTRFTIYTVRGEVHTTTL